MGKDFLKVEIQEEADGTGNAAVRSALGAPGAKVLLGGRPRDTGRSYRSPGFLDSVLGGLGPLTAIGWAHVSDSGVLLAAAGIASSSRVTLGVYELKWPSARELLSQKYAIAAISLAATAVPAANFSDLGAGAGQPTAEVVFRDLSGNLIDVEFTFIAFGEMI